MDTWIIDEIKKLPQDVQERVLSTDFTGTLAKTLDASGVSKDLYTIVFEEIMLFLTAYTHPNDFSHAIGLAAQLNEEKGDALTLSILENMLIPIMPPLMEYWQSLVELDEESTTIQNSIHQQPIPDPFLLNNLSDSDNQVKTAPAQPQRKPHPADRLGKTIKRTSIED